MACEITSGFQLACRDNTGGIKNIYILSGSVSTVAYSCVLPEFRELAPMAMNPIKTIEKRINFFMTSIFIVYVLYSSSSL